MNTKKVLNNYVIKSVCNKLIYQYKADEKFWSLSHSLSNINTLGCFTRAGVGKINEIIYSSGSAIQEYYLQVLQDVYKEFLLMDITVLDLAHFVYKQYLPIVKDSGINAIYENLLYNNLTKFVSQENDELQHTRVFLKHYGLLFVQVMVFKLITTELNRQLLPLLEEKEKVEFNKHKNIVMKKLLGTGNENDK